MIIEDILNNPEGEDIQQVRDLTPAEEEVLVVEQKLH